MSSNVTIRSTFFSKSDLGNASSGESHGDSHHVNCELELQELGNAVIDISAPHHSLDDAGEIIVCQDDVGGLLRYICPCDSL